MNHSDDAGSRHDRSLPASASKWLAVAAILATGAILFLGASASSGSQAVTVALEEFELECPVSASEGETLDCTLTNTGDETESWPVVGILHLSTDVDRALVRGSAVDVEFGTLAPDVELDGGVWWVGDTLVAYSRFDWDGEAAASGDPAGGDSRTVPVAIVNDADHEGAERFYISLGPDGSRGVGILSNSRQPVTVLEDDTKSTEAGLSHLTVSTPAEDLYSARPSPLNRLTVAYPVTELTVTGVAAGERSTLALSVAHDGDVWSVPVESGEESAAVALGVGVTTLTVTVVAEDGVSQQAYKVEVIRESNTAGVDVEVRSEGFVLACPYQMPEGETLECTLTNTGTSSSGWPTVAIFHSSADGDRALVAEDPLIPESHPDFSRDVRLSLEQSPPPEAYNFGYGELFSGGSIVERTTYGYEKFDWTGEAEPGDKRTVVVEILSNDDGEEREQHGAPEVFYVAIAPDGYTGLSKLVANKVPVVVMPERPWYAPVLASNAADTSVLVSWTLPDMPAGVYVDEMYLERLDNDGSVAWSSLVQSDPSPGAHQYRVYGLDPATDYRFRVRLDMDFGDDVYSAPMRVRTQTDAPAAPTGLSATTTHDSVTLSWTVPQQPAWISEPVTLRVMRELLGQKARMGSVAWQRAVTGYSFTDTDVAPGQTYHYYIEMISIGGQVPRPRSERLAVTTAALAEDPDGNRGGATVLDARAAVDWGQFLSNLSLNRGTGDSVDYYRFTISERYRLVLAVRRVLGSWDEPIYDGVSLEDAEGNTIVESSPPVSRPFDPDTVPDTLDIEIGPGVYYVRVEATGDGHMGYLMYFNLEVASPGAPEGPNTAPTSVAAGPLTGFSLIDAADQQVLGDLVDGARIELLDPANGSYAIRADTEVGVAIGSVGFEFSTDGDTLSKTENLAPYSLRGDNGPGALLGAPLAPGSHMLRATAYSQRNRTGDQLGTLEVSFTIAEPTSTE